MLDKEDNTIWCDECDCEQAEYTYNNQDYCGGCLLLKLAEEEKIQTWNVNHYMCNDEYCGNDNDNEIDDIIKQVSKRSYKDFDIRKIEED